MRSKKSFSSYTNDISIKMEKDYKQFQKVTERLTTYLRIRENVQRRGEDEVWKRIEENIEGKKRFLFRRRLYIISTVAAVLLLLFLSVEYLWLRDSDPLDAYVALLDEPTLDSSQIQVYLSPEEKVMVEENTASVSYSPKGNVSINQMEQSDTLSKNKEQEFNQIVVPKGKYTHLTLSDGSTVHINSGSRVVYPRVFSSESREIYVEGEVCLDVTKNENVPFIVKTASFDVKVLGTIFNVNAYKGDSDHEVVLIEGSVRLSDQHKNRIELRPDQLVAVNQGKIGEIKKVDASDYIAWTNGLLVLQSEPLSKVFKKLERFYGISIHVSPDAGLLKMKGKIDLKQSLDDLIVLISSSAPIRWNKTDGEYYIDAK